MHHLNCDGHLATLLASTHQTAHLLQDQHVLFVSSLERYRLASQELEAKVHVLPRNLSPRVAATRAGRAVPCVARTSVLMLQKLFSASYSIHDGLGLPTHNICGCDSAS